MLSRERRGKMIGVLFSSEQHITLVIQEAGSCHSPLLFPEKFSQHFFLNISSPASPCGHHTTHHGANRLQLRGIISLY